MEYNVDYPLLDITTSVYKYEGKPLTPEQGQEYLKKYSQLTPVPELGQHYTTVDENGMALETVEEKTLEMDVKYADCSAYYIAVKVVSYATGMAVGATVTSEVVGENTWDANTGDAVILKGASGKTIVFGFGLNKTQKSSNGYFDFNITFEYLEDYVFEGGQIDYTIPNHSAEGGEISGGIVTAEEDGLIATVPVSTNITQMAAEGADGDDLTDPANVSMYGVFINLNANGFTSDSNVKFGVQNIRFYDQNGNQIKSATMHMLIGLVDKTITNVDEMMAEQMAMMGNLGLEQTCSVSMVASSGKNAVATLVVGFTNQYNTDGDPYIYSVDFDLVIEYNVEPDYALDYEYRFELMADGTAIVAPGTLLDPGATILPTTTVDAFAPKDYVVDVSMTLPDAVQYFMSFGRYLPNEAYLPAYLNHVVWTQIMMLMMMGEQMGAIPVPKEDFTYTIEGAFSYTFLRKNWFKDFMVLTMLMENVFTEEAAMAEFFAQYYMPLPTGENDTITVPIHMYAVENAGFALHYMSAMYTVMLASENSVNFSISSIIGFLQTYFKFLLWSGQVEPSAMELPEDYTDVDILFIAYSMY
ncbi:MAG: hypothetical protein J6Q51_00965, partial [Clostridia bacterium]|nr:hypothetical protein [Clostridia bacterium]